MQVRPVYELLIENRVAEVELDTVVWRKLNS
jgi:hypothetical protein